MHPKWRCNWNMAHYQKQNIWRGQMVFIVESVKSVKSMWIWIVCDCDRPLSWADFRKKLSSNSNRPFQTCLPFLSASITGAPIHDVHNLLAFFDTHCTELGKKACTWFGEICSCSCLPVLHLPCPAGDLLSRICIPYFRALYMYSDKRTYLNIIDFFLHWFFWPFYVKLHGLKVVFNETYPFQSLRYSFINSICS